jgi:subtilisin family serine protease
MLAVLLAAAGMPVDGKPAGESSMILREKGPDGTRLQKLDEPGGVYSAIHATGSDGRTVTRIVSDAPERVIIQLRGTPLARIVAGARSSARQALAAQHTQLEAELARICSQTRQRALASHEVVTREFFTVFNGFAARLSRDEQSQLRRLPDVVEIYLDVEMRATLDVSVPLVGAPAFWSAYSFTGAGTVVAIIDTGVDYTHSDLGAAWVPPARSSEDSISSMTTAIPWTRTATERTSRPLPRGPARSRESRLMPPSSPIECSTRVAAVTHQTSSPASNALWIPTMMATRATTRT